MGYKFEVHYWGNNKDTNKREYKVVYAGESFCMACWKMCRAKQKGIKYIKLEWRQKLVPTNAQGVQPVC